MITSIGPIWILLVLFLCTPDLNLKTSMTLDEQQLNAVKETYSKWKQLNNYCKEHQLQLNEILTVEELKEIKEGKEWLQKLLDNPQISAAVLADFPLSYKTFVAKITRWIRDFKIELATVEDEKALLPVNIVIGYLKSGVISGALPISQQLWEPIGQQLKSLETKSTPKVIATAIIQGLEAINIDLKAEYKANRKEFYSKLTNQDFDAAIIQPNDFLLWLNQEMKEATLREDKEEQEAVLREKEKAAESLEAFSKKLEERQEEEIAKLEALSTYGDTADMELSILDVSALKKNQGTVTMPLYSLDYWKDLQSKVFFAIEQKKNMITLGQAKEITKKVLRTSLSQKDIEDLYQVHSAAGGMGLLYYPSGFAAWFNDSRDRLDSSAFKAELDIWIEDMRSCIGKKKDRLREKRQLFRVHPKVFLEELKPLFSQLLDTLGSNPGELIYKKIAAELASIKGQTQVSMNEIDELWQKGLTECSTDKFAKDAYIHAVVNHIKTQKQAVQAAANLRQALPIDSNIVDALYNARYISKPLPKPETNGKKLVSVFKLESTNGRGQSMELHLANGLRLVPQELNNMGAYMPVPTQEVEVVKVDSTSYQVKLEKTIIGKTRQETEGNDALVLYTPITYKLDVKDTSEQTVIQEKMKSALSFIDLGVGDMITGGELSKKLGKDSALGGELLNTKIKICGDDYGNIEKIEATFTLLGMAFVVGHGRKGWIAQFKSPFAPTPEKRNFTYGSSDFTLYLTCTYKGALKYLQTKQYEIETIGGKLGTAQGAYASDQVKLKEFDGSPHFFKVRVDNIEDK